MCPDHVARDIREGHADRGGARCGDSVQNTPNGVARIRRAGTGIDVVLVPQAVTSVGFVGIAITVDVEGYRRASVAGGARIDLHVIRNEGPVHEGSPGAVDELVQETVQDVLGYLELRASVG